MTGLALGLAFLTCFGMGVASVVVWCGVAVLLRARATVSSAAALAIVAVAFSGAMWGNLSQSEREATLPSGAYEGISTVVEGPFLTQNGQRLIVRGKSTLNQRVCTYTDASPRPHVGDTVFLSGRVTQPQDLSEIGRAALTARDCSAQLSAETLVIVESGTGIRARLSRFRTALSTFLMQAAPGDTGALLSGLVTGDDGGLSESASDAFLNSGTTHITAISGANFAVLILLLGVMATGSMRRSLWFVAIATSVIWMYAVMVGLQPSALRAALLATAVLVGHWLGRIPDLLTLTLLLASAQVLARPNDFQTLAFQLSIAATVALIVVFDGSERVPGRSRPVTLAMSVAAAQLATLPILAARLGTVSATGLLANLAIGPLASIAFPISLAGGVIGQSVPWIGETVLIPAVWIGDAMIALVTWMGAHLPATVQLGSPVPGAIVVLTVACWTTIVVMSGDLRRTGRRGWQVIREW